ncbi:MAG: N-formylglutamate deformylase [Gammaproteobacteria bacterium]|nr:N-formylglutamate deformylase [Gammaproteobacteria bacterium]
MKQHPTYALDLRDSPLLISMPHAGTELPADWTQRYTEVALAVPDTDWHLPQLYDFAEVLGASTLWPRYSRYVVDLNRDPSGRSLYPGASTTELCPLSSFAQAPLYRPGQAPSDSEIADRIKDYFDPYHDALQAMLAALRDRHGYAILFEAHSITSRVPRFFEGRLPDFNFGSNADSTLPRDITAGLCRRVQADARWSAIANGRFKGGYITRHYGQPVERVYALQLELSQAVYMIEDGRYGYDEAVAAPVKPLLRELLQHLQDDVARLS